MGPRFMTSRYCRRSPVNAATDRHTCERSKLMSRLVFPPVERPRASIILLAWKRVDLLLTCLRALSDTIGRRIEYEVIVASNDAPQSFRDALQEPDRRCPSG